MGRLIPAGTGMTEYRNTYVVVDGEGEPGGEENQS
jgi:hypothetical protein